LASNHETIIDALRREVAELREENEAWMKISERGSDKGIEFDAWAIRRHVATRGIAPARCLAVLYRANGAPVSTERLDAANPTRLDRDLVRTRHHIAAWIHYARKAVGHANVINHYGAGYSLTPEGLAIVRAFLGPE
jgi:predicted TIM-barrel fold metal-dependent hydrolase